MEHLFPPARGGDGDEGKQGSEQAKGRMLTAEREEADTWATHLP